jgi:hypothetical protein
MPLLLISPDFEPDSEREFLFLDGVDFDEKKNVISDAGINKMILKESVHSHDKLVEYLSRCNHNYFLLSKGLRKAPNVQRYFQRDWFLNEIIMLTEKC